MDERGRRRFEKLRMKLLFLSAAAVCLPSCLILPMCGGKLGDEMLVAAGWELPLMLGGIALAGLFLFIYVARFMRQSPTELPHSDGGHFTEQQLIRKLVTTWHLSVSERRTLPKQKARASLACQAIVDVLQENGWFPPDWRPDQAYDGGLIERRPDGTYDIYWKAEGAIMRFKSLSVDHYAIAHDAARDWLRRTFPRDIDGVELDWRL